LNTGKRIIMIFLVLTVLFSFVSCGKKTSLFLKDRAGSSGINYSQENINNNK
jgi:predicted small lipoprotein YifL